MVLPFILRKYAVHIINALRDVGQDSVLKENNKLKDYHKGEHCFILGSGRSIVKQDITRLKGETVITQNNFFVHEDVELISPKYHVVVPKYQSDDYDDDWVTWLKQMEDALPGDCRFFFGKNSKNLVDRHTSLGERSYYVKTGHNPLFLNKAKVDMRKRIMNIPTALTECLVAALFMGFDTIYLTGQDMDAICKYDRDNMRFYGNSVITKNNAEKQIEDIQYSSGRAYFNRWNTWIQLNLIRTWAEKNNRRIINLTEGGLLDVFERGSYDDVVSSLKN